MENIKFKQIELALDSFEKSIKQAQYINFNTKAVDGKIIGTGRADYTQDTTGYKLIHKQKPFVLYDVPGIEGNEEKYEKIIRKAVDKAHLIFYVNGSSKKPEQGTAEKLKKYLRNYTDVYSVINLHLPPKNERDVEIDGTYQAELDKEYSKYLNTIKPQTENVLKPILLENYKETIILNGLEAFSAHSFNENTQTTTIYADTEEEDKGLRKTQKKFFKEYNALQSPIKEMVEDSRINEITKIIDNQAENFLPYIIETNKKKLIARLDSSLKNISEVETKANKMCKEFIELYKEFINKSKNAKECFCDYIENSHIVNAVTFVINNELKNFYDIIEKKEGKIKKDDYERFFDKNKNEEIQKNIREKLEKDFNDKLEDFKNDIEKASKRFNKDMDNILKIDFPELTFPSFKSEKNMSEIIKEISKIVTLVKLGLPFGWVGGLVGALLGALLVWKDVCLLKNEKIAKKNSEAKKHFEKLNLQICNELKQNLNPKEYTVDICNITEDITKKCNIEISKFENIPKSLKNLAETIKDKSIKIKEKNYGTL